MKCPLGLEIGESLCLEYVPHGTPIPDEHEAVEIAHHSEFAVLVSRRTNPPEAEADDDNTPHTD